MLLPFSFRTLPVLTALVILLAACVPLHAQWGRSGDNILYPQTERSLYIGPEFGWGLWTSRADFTVTDSQLPCAQFVDGDGSGPAGGARAFIYLNDWLILAPRLRYESRPGTFSTTLTDELIHNDANESTMLQQEAKVDATMAAATLDLMLGVDVASTGFYVAAGLGTSLLIQGTYDYTERITSPDDIVYDDTGTNEHTLVKDGAFENYKELAFDLRGGGGYLLKLGRWAINPEVFYSLPLTSLLDTPDDMKQTGLVLSLGLLLDLNGTN